MTTEEFLIKQRKAFTQIIEKDVPLQRATKTVVAAQATRIFVEGKNSSNGNIGQYDTKRPMYINPEKSPRKTGDKIRGIEGLLPTRGKTGEHVFENGKTHKTTFVNNHKDFRNRIGRRIDRVDLFLSGDLKSDFSNSKAATAEPVKVDVHQYVVGLKRNENIKKLEGIEKKYGIVFHHTEGEKILFKDIAFKEFQLILNA